MLRRLYRMTSGDARIIVESRDVEHGPGSDAPWHRRYRERNVTRGQAPRAEPKSASVSVDVVGPWLDYPMVSPDQLREILAGTRWYVAHGS